MKYLLYLIVTLGAIAGVLVLLVSELFTAGTLGVMPSLSDIVNIRALQAVNPEETDEQVTTGEPAESPVMRFTWRNDEIIYNENVIDEAEFARLLDEAKVQGARVEILKSSDVTVEAADRWRLLLDQVEVTYEIIPQE